MIGNVIKIKNIEALKLASGSFYLVSFGVDEIHDIQI